MAVDTKARRGADPIAADAALVARIGAGDPTACRALMDAHLGRVHGYAWRMLGDAGEAEDVAQECFLRLWRQAGRWRAEARVATWLHRVAHNLCIDRLRRRRAIAAEEPPDRADPAPGPAGESQRARVAQAVAAALARLPERQRAAIALVHYQELGNIEAADIMGISVEALESLLARGRRALRAALGAMRDDLMGEP
ncbi:MAG: RNA polymerase sigma factor [Rhodospirillales bacterium]|nr:MAG: RNA polymerase sigma factor [Rhodospirillales bacterium]